MLIALFGENCTGKSTLADALKTKLDAKVYAGKDYLRLAKNEAEAEERFRLLLKDSVSRPETVIYIINQKAQLSLLPQGCIRVLVTAPLSEIKTRFAKRMNGMLPSAVETMLERNHGLFDAVPCDVHIENGKRHVLEDCAHILALADGKY